MLRSPMELVLIRHAEPVRVADGRERADPTLTDRGRRQAARVARWLADEGVDAVWTSPLRRAVETAEPLASLLDLKTDVDDGLAEYDRDATSYIPVEELKATGDDRWFAMVEGRLEDTGVDPEAFRTRVVSAMERIVERHPGQRVAVVSHGGVINAYTGHVLGISRPLWFEPVYGSISRVLASSGGVRSIGSLNETAHLRDA